MAAKIQVDIFWVATPCSDVVGYRRFGGPFLPPSSVLTLHLNSLPVPLYSRDSSAGISLGYGLDDRGFGFDSLRGLGIFL
jgi:hypothetical protein